MGAFHKVRFRLGAQGLLVGACFAWLGGIKAGSATEVTSFESLKAVVRELADAAYVPPTEVGPEWTDLSYVDYSQIQFRPDHALWGGQKRPFQIEFMHPGYVHRHAVEVAEQTKDGSQPVLYSTNSFVYGEAPIRPMSSRPSGFAGFKVVSVNDGYLETGSFLGASYFRFLGTNQVYGLSARGLALNVLDKEQFPIFRRFWLERPEPNSRELRLFALLDSPSIVGGFEFRIRSGATAVTRVQAYFQPRQAIKDPGIAPLTSMFLHDDNGRDVHRDFRPEVHDSDGLLMHSGEGRWIWRPLDKGRMMRVNAYSDEHPRGFGLLQRDRDFTHYEDPIARFERRPSAWVEPIGPWGKGSVVLVQLPSDREFSDNVVVYWRPDGPTAAREPWEYTYDIHWTTERLLPRTLAAVVSSRIGAVVVEPPKPRPNLRFVIDFAGGPLRETSQLRAETKVGPGATKVADSLYYIRETGVWRLVMEITQPRRAVDLQAVLHLGSETASERWTFTWQP